MVKVHRTVSLPDRFGVKIPEWGFFGSPVVLGQMLLIDAGRIIAFDKKTGREIWKTRDYGSSYSTPSPFNLGGRQMVAVFPQSGLAVLDATNGRQITFYPWRTRYEANTATPINEGRPDSHHFWLQHRRGSAAAGGPSSASPLENKGMRYQMSTPVLVDGHLYGFDDARLKFLDFATGRPKWSQRGLGKGSLMAADGKLIVMSEKGERIIADASPERFVPISSARLFNAQDSWIMPVLANGRIYCRSSKGRLVCLDVRVPESRSSP